jgi:hypothetical protein
VIRPGSDTVTFKKPGQVQDALHRVTAVAPSQADVTGCSFQPLSVKDDISNTAFSSATHRCIAPTNATTLACKAEDELIYNGQTYRVRGTKKFGDRQARIHHVTVYVEEEH